MTEENVIIRVPFPYLDERLYPAGWRSFNNEVIALNSYYIQSEIIGLNKIADEIINEIISVNGIPIDSLGYFGIYELLADTSVEEYQFLIITPEGDVEDVTIPAE